jgi:translocation and assembly module TamA
LHISLLWLAGTALAQKPKQVWLEPYETLRKHAPASAIRFAYKDSSDAHRKTVSLISYLHSIGFLTVAIDSTWRNGDTLRAKLYLGTQFKKASIGTRHLGPYALRKTGTKSVFAGKRRFSPQELYRAEQTIVDFYQTIGFPFSSVYIDSISISNGQIKGELKLSQGPFIVFDSLEVEGKTKTKSKFLSHYTRIRKGNPYDQTLVDNAYRLLKQLPYVNVTDYPSVTFVDGKARVVFYIEDRRANQIDGVAGFLPNQSTGSNTTTSNKLIITGELSMVLKNMGGKGKGLNLEWKRLKPESQQINLEYFHPNLLGSVLHVQPTFNLLKQDTTFQTITGTLKISVNLTGSAKIGMYASSKQSRLISTKQYASYKKPPFLDFNLNTYGLDYEWNSLDNYFYPKRGSWFYLDANVGIKTIKTNSRLSEVLYDGVKSSSTQFYLKGEAKHFFRTGKKNTLLTGIRMGRVFNDNLLLTNDLFQMGGLKTLRGFNENFFFAEYYSTATLEFRQFTDESSYLLVFAEKSFMNYRVGSESLEDWPTGLGAGISLNTNTGIFNFVYSVGGAIVQKMQFNQSKVHFGYITRF